MALNANVGTAWISVVADTAKIAPSITKSIGAAEKGISGEGIGSKLSAGIGKTLKVGVGAAGVAAGGILAASLTKGLGRLTGIENAQAKLAGLGHEAESVTSIMDDALASVKGTAFGLEDAATVAASAVAAGIKPGQDLQRTLKLTGDAATIAGTDISSMGAIFNKVAASNKMQMDVANQLMDAGIPIMQMVADQMGVTAEEAVKMASDGKISFEIFQTALEEGLGGAALKSGETVQGAFANMGAAAGRFGAKLADPVFKAAPAIFTALGGSFDAVNTAITPATERIGAVLTPALESLASVIETRVTPWLGEMAGKAGDLAASGLEKALDPSNWEYVGEIFGKISGVVQELWPSLRSLGESFLIIAQNISMATWTALTAALDALAPLVETVLVPLVQKIAEFSEQNPGAVQAIVVALLGFKAVGAIAGPVGTAAKTIGTLSGSVSGVSKAFKGATFGQGLLTLMSGAKSANPILAALGKTIGTIFSAFWKLMPVLANVGKVFMTVIRFVNPWVAGITLLIGALTWFFTQTETGQAIVENAFGAMQNAWNWVVEAVSSGWENYIKPTLEALWVVAQNVLGVIATVILAPLLISWNLLSAGIKSAWENIIKPAWEAMSSFAMSLYSDHLAPIFAWIGEKWTFLGSVIQLGQTMISYYWDLLKFKIGELYHTYIAPIVAWIGEKWQWLSDRINFGVNLIRGYLDLLIFKLQELWAIHVQPILDSIAGKWLWLKDKFGEGWNWIRDNVFTKFQEGLDGLRNFASSTVDAIRDVWQKLKGYLAEPINFMINTVYNNGIRRAWNVMAGDGTNDGFLPGLKSAPAVAPIQGYRAGGEIQSNPTGRISGPGTGTSDSILARIANGEHMWTAAEVKALGSHERMYRLRNLILNNIPFTADGNGHFQPLPRGIDNSLGDLAGAAPDLLPKFANGGEIKPAWESQLEAAHRFAKAQHGKQYQWAGPTGPGSSFDCSGFMGSIAATIQGTNPWQRYWATMSFPSPGAQGFVPGLGQGFSIGVWNGGPYGGHTSGTLSRAGNFPTTNVESGGSPSMVKYGIGAAGADSPQHKMHFHLPIGADGAFESGGAGGGFFDYLGGIKSWITEKFGKILDPIKDKLPSPPPEWLGIPGAAYKSGKDGLTKTITEKVENLGDLTSAVWAKLTDFDFDLFDTGGVWKPGRAGLNLSGKNEYVFTNKSMQSFQQATESLQVVAREFSEAFAGGDWGYGELASYVGEDIAHALVNEAAWLGGAKDEIVAAFDGVDGGLASVARYLGGNEKLAREVLSEVENLGTVGKEFSAAFRGEDFGSGATGSYIGQANAERLLDEVSWIGAAVDEVRAAWKGQDSGYAGVMRYLGGNAQMAVTALNAVESAGTVATEISEAFAGGDWGTGEMERYVGPMVAQAVFDTARAAGSFMRREHDDYIHAKYGDFGNLARSLEIIAAGGPKAWGEAAYDVINTAMTRNFNGSAWLQEDSPLVVAALHIGNTLGQWQAQWNQNEVNAELRKSAEDYALGEARSALNLFGLGEAVDIAIGLGEKAQDVLNSDDVRNGVAEVKRLVLDPSQHYLGEEIEKKVTELGVEVEHLKSELGSSTIGGYIGMA